MTRVSRRTVIAGSTAAMAAAGARSASAQGGVTTLVVPFPPGGSTDALARIMQPGLEKRLGRTVLVDNKAGAASSIGASHVAKAKPDGTTLLVTFDSHAVIPAILDKPIVDVEKDLVPVCLVATAPYVLATGADKPYKSFADVLAAAKAKPGAVNFGSVGLGTIGHLAMTVLSKRAGVEITHAPYRGGGPAMNDLIGGHIELVCGSVALIIPHINGGKARPIVQMGAKRVERLKDTPTVIESGFDGFIADAWWGVFAPKGTPDAIVAQVEAAIRDTIRDPEISKRLIETQEMTLALGGPAELDAFFKQQVANWGKVVRENQIKAQ